MPSNRRVFLQKALVAGSAIAVGGGWSPRATAQTQAAPPVGGGKLKLLILGGTSFLGPAIVHAALARGHSVSAFNRGITEKKKGELPEQCERIIGDRDPNVGEGLKALQGRQWDAVIDTSGYVPRIVKASAELLAPNVKQYLFISTLSVYAKNDQLNADESDTLGTIEDPTTEEISDGAYGPLKALCEQAAEAALPGRATIVRPGYIVGPGDPSDRFTYWPVRVSKGGEMLAPGEPGDRVQIIDVHDLGEWVVHLLESGTMGIFNACGPKGRLTIGEVLLTSQKVSGSNPTLTWVSADFLEKHEASVPIWIPPKGEYAGFHTRSNVKAVEAGLKFRPVETTIKDTLAWFPGEMERRARVTKQMVEDARSKGEPEPKVPDPTVMRAGLSPEQERELLSAWHAAGNK